MFNLLRRFGVLSACCLTLVCGPVTAMEAPITIPYSSKTTLISALASQAPDLDVRVLTTAVSAMRCAVAGGAAPADRLAVIDFSLPSSTKRLWIFDLKQRTLMLQDLVAHGQGSGDNLARSFSNIEGSHQSSIGLFRTQESYIGQHGYSLRMDGLEPGINDRARERAIVVHSADYVSNDWVKKYGRIGRSQGCPAVRPEVASMVVDSLKGGQFMFSWYPDNHWLSTSALINCPYEVEDKRMTASR